MDSRCQGTVPIDNVIGRAFVIMWPSDHWARLPVPSTFDKVPRPYAAASLLPGSAGTAPEGSDGPVVAAGRSADERHLPGLPDAVVLFGVFAAYDARRRVPGVHSQLEDVGSLRD